MNHDHDKLNKKEKKLTKTKSSHLYYSAVATENIFFCYLNKYTSKEKIN